MHDNEANWESSGLVRKTPARRSKLLEKVGKARARSEPLSGYKTHPKVSSGGSEIEKGERVRTGKRK